MGYLKLSKISWICFQDTNIAPRQSVQNLRIFFCPVNYIFHEQPILENIGTWN